VNERQLWGKEHAFGRPQLDVAMAPRAVIPALPQQCNRLGSLPKKQHSGE